MKTLIIVMIFILMGVAPTLAAQKLSEGQLEAITAGSSDGTQRLSDTTVDNNTHDITAQKELDFGSPNAENVINAPAVNVNNSVDTSQNIDSRNSYLTLRDSAQENVKAVNVENAIGSQIANAINVHLNGLRPDDVLSGSSSLNNLYQTNIVYQNHQ